MTIRARVTERGQVMDGIGLSVISLMAGKTIRRRAAIPLTVTGQAVQGRMRTQQWKTREAMIEGRGAPVGRTVARFTLRGKTLRHVVGILSSDEILLMASVTHRCSPGVDAVSVARRAISGEMCAGQSVVRLGVMIETRGRPGRRVVAFRTDVAERGRGVNGIIGGGLEICLVTGDARR